MWHRKGIATLALVGLLGVILALAIACGGGVSQTEYDAVKEQLSSEQQKAAALQQQLSEKLGEVTQLQQQITANEGDVTAALEQLAVKEKEAAELQARLEAETGLPLGGSILLAAKPVPTPTPRPTPTPVPPGYTPPPPPVPPASFYEPRELFIYADTVTAAANESKYNVDATGIPNWACVQTSVFKRGMHIVWRYEIMDAAIGTRLSGNDVESAVVRLATGEEIKGRFGRHGTTEDAPWFWTSAWDVPPDYPLGVLDWTLAVTTKESKTGSFKPLAVSIPARNVESRLQIID